MEESHPPHDAFHLTYIIFFLQGIGTLFPWNVFITAEAYYHKRFCGTMFESNFENFFGVCFNVACCSGLGIATMYQHRIQQRSRVIVPLWITLLLFVLTSGLVWVDGLSPIMLFLVTVVCVFITGLASAILQGGLFGLVSLLPTIYTQAIMVGQGLAGLAVSASSLVITALSSEQPDNECAMDYGSIRLRSFLFFSIANLVTLLCIITYYVLERQPVVIYHVTMHQQLTASSTRSGVEKPAGESNGNRVSGSADNAAEGSETTDLSRRLLVNGSEGVTSDPDQSPTAGCTRVWFVLRHLSSMAASVFTVFFITLLLYPSVTSKIASVQAASSGSRFFHDLFVPVGFCLFTGCDFIGRSVAGWKQVIPARFLWVWVVLRAGFVPLFLLCNVGGPHTLFDQSDAWPLVFIGLFGFSSGYLGSLAMMYGPQRVPVDVLETAGTLMVCCLQFGLALGSVVSFAWLPITR